MIARRLSLAAVVLASWSLFAATGHAQTTLRYQFKKGEDQRYAIEQKMKMTMNVMGNNVETTMDQTSEMNLKIQSVGADGSAKLVVSFGRCKMSMDTPMGKIAVDSNNAQAPDDEVGKILHKVITALASLEVDATMSPLGTYSEVKVPEKYLKAFQELPGADAFGEMFNAEGIKRMMSQGALVLPKEAVSKGGSWKSKNDVKMPFGKMVVDMDYTYGGSEEKSGRTLEKIGVKLKAAVEPKADAPVTLKLKGQQGTGTAWFDNATGRLLEVVNQQTMDMDVEQMGLTIGVRTVQTVTMRLVEKK